MLLFIERELFLKLFKFGEIKISVSRILDGYDPVNENSDIPLEILDSRVPLFEQDHEILILEVPKESMIIGFEVSLKISSIRKIYPLTEEAEKYLIGRMNPSIIFQPPVFGEQVNKLKNHRDFRYRLKAWEALAVIFQVDKGIVTDYANELIDGLNFRLGYIKKAVSKKYLASLMSFNRNPVYSQGNIEYLFKSASVFVEMKNGTENDFERGPLYNFLENNAYEFKRLSLNECILRVKSSNEAKPLIDELSKQYAKIDALAIGVWFLYLKDTLNKNGCNIALLKEDISNLKTSFPKESAVILNMIGLLFGFDNLYASLYELNPIPIYNKNPEPGISEQNKELKKKIKEERERSDQLKSDYDRSLKLIEDQEVKINQILKAESNSQDISNILKKLIEEKEPALLKKLALENYELLRSILESADASLKTGKDGDPDKGSKTNPTINEPIEDSLEIIYPDKELQNSTIKKIADSESEKYRMMKSDVNDQIANEPEEVISAATIEKQSLDIENNQADIKLLHNTIEQKREDLNNDSINPILKNEEININPAQVSKDQGKGINKSKSDKRKSTAKTNKTTSKSGLKAKKTDTLFNQQVEMPLDDLNYYEDDLHKIVQAVEEKGIFDNISDKKTFEVAIMNYSPKGGPQHALLNEIEELQTDLKLSDEIVEQLKEIILKVKK